MANIMNLFPSNYLRAADLQGRRIKAVIDRVVQEDIGGEQKAIVYFRNKDKGVVLNKTNATTLASMFGDETDDWSGGNVEISSAKVMFQGKMVDGIRLYPVPSAPAAQPAPKQAPAAPPASAPLAPGHALDDDIPFSPL